MFFSDNSTKFLPESEQRKDVRIAAIALPQNAIVVTWNLKDFELISNLDVGD